MADLRPRLGPSRRRGACRRAGDGRRSRRRDHLPEPACQAGEVPSVTPAADERHSAYEFQGGAEPTRPSSPWPSLRRIDRARVQARDLIPWVASRSTTAHPAGCPAMTLWALASARRQAGLRPRVAHRTKPDGGGHVFLVVGGRQRPDRRRGETIGRCRWPCSAVLKYNCHGAHCNIGRASRPSSRRRRPQDRMRCRLRAVGTGKAVVRCRRSAARSSSVRAAVLRAAVTCGIRSRTPAEVGLTASAAQ